MKNNFLSIFLAGVLILLLVLISDPFMLWMPDGVQMAVLLAVVLLALVWAGLMLYERPSDERELLHTMRAGRLAYLSGIVVLTLALLIQGLAHAIDPWIAGALGVMVITKLFARLYTERYQ